MVWNKARITRRLKKLHKAGKDLSYNRLAKKEQALVSAAAYHFGSFRRAVEAAGIDYDQITLRPRWTKARIIALIRKAKRKGDDLHWSAVTRRRDELGRAAFASLQHRLFKSWGRALEAAGLNAAQESRYRHWTEQSIVAEIKLRHQKHKLLNSGTLQAEDPGLHAAAVRKFGSYDKALSSAGLNPQSHRRRATRK